MNLFFYTFLFIFGTIFGSFASVLVWRIHSKEGGISTGRSHCPACGHTLSFLDLFPILSYIFLRGKCRFCSEKISPFYPLLELTTGILFLFSGMFLVDIQMLLMGSASEWLRLGFFLLVALATVVFVFYDFRFMEIPDEVLIPVNILLFFLLLITSLGIPLPFFSHFLLFDNTLLDIPVINATVGSVLIFSFFYVQIVLSEGKWIGGGDLRIALFMGLIAGTKIAMLGLLLSYFSGSIIGIILLAINRHRDTEMPFGPYLALGLYLSLFFYTPIMEFMTRMFVIG